MTGIAGFLEHKLSPAEAEAFLASTDLRETGHLSRAEFQSLSMCVSSPTVYWHERRTIKVDGAVVGLAGAPVCESGIRWEPIVRGLRAGNHAPLRELAGRFALAVLDKSSGALYLVTDRIGQYPLYIYRDESSLGFSTSQASFCRLPRVPKINEQWIHEFFLVNFAASHCSFLKGVRRLPPATMMRYEIASRATTEVEYASPIVIEDRTEWPTGAALQKVLEPVLDTFSERMRLYYSGAVQMGLSGGFDSRVLLSMFRPADDIRTHTYGIPGCDDIKTARKLVAVLESKPVLRKHPERSVLERFSYETRKVSHSEVPFDSNFTERLPQHALDVVWLSSGLERVARATLAHVYRTVGPNADSLLSGICGDQLFRGHGNVPSIVSPIMAAVFRAGQLPDDLAATCNQIFLDGGNAESTVRSLVDQLTTRYGDQKETSAHLAYMIYETPAEYFSGIACLADQFTDLRAPFSDIQLIKVAAETPFSTRTFSIFGRRDRLLENFLHARILWSENAALYSLPIHGRAASIYGRGQRFRYRLSRLTALARRRRNSRLPPPPLEDWDAWFRGPLAPMTNLLGRDALIREYVNEPFIERAVEQFDARNVNKLLTAELILRLAHSGWQRSSIPQPEIKESRFGAVAQ